MTARDASGDPFEACAHCDAPFEPGVSYPVAVERRGEGDPELYSFCDVECEAAWRSRD